MQVKKVFIILLLLLVVGCNKNEENIEESPFIDPITNTSAIDQLDKGISKKLKNLFGPIDDVFIDESLNLIGQNIDVFDLSITDIDGNTYNLSDYKESRILVEIAATYCTHCGQQLDFIPKVRELLDDDVTIFQVFADKEGDFNQIKEFYVRNGHTFDKGINIIPYSYDFVDRIVSLGIDQTPTFMFIDNGVCSFALSSFNDKFLNNIVDHAFSNEIKRSDLINTKGQPIEKYYRTKHTLRDELNQDSLEYLDSLNKSNSAILCEIAGKKIDFNSLTNVFDTPLLSLDSFDKYSNDQTIVFCLTRDKAEDIERDIYVINTIIDEHPEIKFFVVFLDDIDYYFSNSSELYIKSNSKLKTDAVSSLSSIPYFIKETALNFVYDENTPMMLFIDDSYVTGVSVGSRSLISYETLINMFFGEDSITLKKNLYRNY